jgi:hypothetical protein
MPDESQLRLINSRQPGLKRALTSTLLACYILLTTAEAREGNFFPMADAQT